MKISLRVLALLFLPLAGCVSTKVAGQLNMQGNALGDSKFAAAKCYSGDRYYFYGVDLVNQPQDTILRVVVDPVGGTVLKVTKEENGSERQVLFDQGSCQVIDGHIDKTGWRVNRIEDFSGTLKLDCTTNEGEHIQGDLQFQHCH